MDYEHADALNEAIHSIGVRHRDLATRALAPLGIHPGHKLVLFELAATGPSTQASLAAACGFEPPTITLQVRQLEAAGLVTRRPSPSDKRAVVVELTPAGKALLPRIRTAWRRVAADTVAGLEGHGIEEVTEVLSALAASLERLDQATTVRRPATTRRTPSAHSAGTA